MNLQMISHVLITLKTVKGSKQLRLDPTIYDVILKQRIEVGDVIYIEANSGAVKVCIFYILCFISYLVALAIKKVCKRTQRNVHAYTARRLSAFSLCLQHFNFNSIWETHPSCHLTVSWIVYHLANILYELFLIEDIYDELITIISFRDWDGVMFMRLILISRRMSSFQSLRAMLENAKKLYRLWFFLFCVNAFMGCK